MTKLDLLRLEVRAEQELNELLCFERSMGFDGPETIKRCTDTVKKRYPLLKDHRMFRMVEPAEPVEPAK
jgi:hypothetical protein